MDNFKHRRLMAWISFFILIILLIVSCFGAIIVNEGIVSTIVVGLVSIVISYFTSASVETIKLNKNKNNEQQVYGIVGNTRDFDSRITGSNPVKPARLNKNKKE